MFTNRNTQLTAPFWAWARRLAGWMRHNATLRNTLLLAGTARLAAIAILHNFHKPVLFEYGVISRYLLAGKGYAYYTIHGQALPSAFMPPAYAYFLAGMFWAFGDETVLSIVTSQLIQAALGVLLVYLVYRIGWLYWGEDVALLAALVATLYPPFVYMCTEMANISFYLVINTALFFYVSRFLCESRKLSYMVKAGVLLGFLMLFRAETLALVFLLAAVVLYKKRSCWREVAVFALLALGVLGPWTIRNFMVFHRLIPTTTAMPLVMWYGHNSQATGTQRIGWNNSKVMEPLPPMQAKLAVVPVGPEYEIQLHHIYLEEALDFIRHHPGQEMLLVGKKFFYYWTFDMHHPKARHPAYWIPTMLLIVLFWVGAARERHGLLARYSLFVVYILFSMTLALLFHVLPRYRMFVEPLMLPFAAQGLLVLSRRLIGAAATTAYFTECPCGKLRPE